MCVEESAEVLQKKSAPMMIKLNVDIKMGKGVDEISDEIEEPVSPPACHPEEGPPLLLSQSIEDIASEVVGENWPFSRTGKMDVSETDFNFIPKTVEKERRTSIGSLIPLTVSDISEDPPAVPTQPSPTLHMSGGMVSTDVTPSMSSVPTSVITSNTNNKPKVQFFLKPIIQRESVQSDNQIPFNPTQMFPYLPMDLSITKVTKMKGQSNQKTPTDDNLEQSSQKDFQDRAQISCGVKRSRLLDVKDTEEAKRQKKDNCSSIEIIPVRDTKVKSKVSTGPECLDCKLILPKRKNEKARIVFANGIAVEIDRNIFNSLEQTIVKKTPNSRESVKKVESAKIGKADNRRKKESSKTKKQSTNKIQTSIINEHVSMSIENSKQARDELDERPKDMPMIVTNNSNEDDESSKQTNILEKRQISLPNNLISSKVFSLIPSSVISTTASSASLSSISSSQSPKSIDISNLVSVPTPSAETPPPSPPSPSNPSSPPGIHKLPSIVSKPSYYRKPEGRKMLKVK